MPVLRTVLLIGAWFALAGPALPATVPMRWVVSATEAATLIEAGALVLDVRSARLRWWDPAPGAVPTSPALLAEPELPSAGRLLADDAELGRRLQALGVRNDTAVVVLGDPKQGWAEDGRLVWSLRALGHERTVLVDGGLPALQAADLPAIRPPVLPGDFTVARRADLVIGGAEVRALLGSPAVVLDVREPAEYAGTESHGERRLGHLPGARSLPWRDLLSADGTLLPEPLLRARLAAAGVGPDSEVVAYCSGGVRSGWVTTVLNDLGVPARNYAGSMWEWAAGDPVERPLVVGR